MKVAIVGYGGQGGWHGEYILASDVVELAGIYDINEDRCAFARSKGIHVYDSFEALAADESVEIVLVATPNDSHKEYTIKALKSGKNVICEKPVEMSAVAFDEMCAAAKESGKLFSVHQNRRWDSDFLTVKKTLESGEIGNAIHIESRVHGSRGIPGDWRQKKECGGGMILDWGVHLLDQMLLLIPAKIVGIFCTTTHITNDEVDDGFRLELFFETGASAHVEVGTYNFLSMPRFYMLCEGGSLIINGWTAPAHIAKMHTWNEKQVTPVVTASGITKTMAPRDDVTIDEYDKPQGASDVHDYYRNFTRAAMGLEESAIKHAEVRRVLRVMETALESAQKKQYIRVEI